MIYFIGDRASKNYDPSSAFIGTYNYRKLLCWIFKMDLNINNVRLYNANSFIKDIEPTIKDTDIVAAIGKGPSMRLCEKTIPHYRLPFFEYCSIEAINKNPSVKEMLEEYKSYDK
jgi:hypothetical protein